MALAEPLNQWRTVTEGCEPALGVDVEDEDAAVIEVLVGTVEDPLPLRELQQVVDRVIDAEHDVESLAQGEPRDVGFDETPGTFSAATSSIGADRSSPVTS